MLFITESFVVDSIFILPLSFFISLKVYKNFLKSNNNLKDKKKSYCRKMPYNSKEKWTLIKDNDHPLIDIYI